MSPRISCCGPSPATLCSAQSTKIGIPRPSPFWHISTVIFKTYAKSSNYQKKHSGEIRYEIRSFVRVGPNQHLQILQEKLWDSHNKHIPRRRDRPGLACGFSNVRISRVLAQASKTSENTDGIKHLFSDMKWSIIHCLFRRFWRMPDFPQLNRSSTHT